MNQALEKNYDPHAIEQSTYARWEQSGYFEPRGDGDPYCIMIPPPNVTGTLHMGHAFQDTLMDTLTRYHRMMGRNTLWQAGTDHAGIATQMVVERLLNAEEKTRHDLGRERFIERTWEWKEHSGGHITRQLRRMGASLDWAHERFTMDEGLSKAVHEVFVRLYDEGLIYRGKRLVNWDPVLHTALSDLEVLNEEENSHMWHFRYPIADDSGNATDEFLVVATTRPETMLGDTAVAVNPEDPRFKHLIGRKVLLPLANRLIPVVGDEHADPEKGTGCVKITPAHDFNDYEVGKRHDLPMINILTIDARLNDEVPETYRGMDRYDARKRIVSDLDALGLLDKIENHKLMVPRGDRSGTVVEPYLTDQWYVKIQPLAEPAIEAVESGKIRFIPDNYKNMYFSWMRDIQDWCISRQLWWGHRIPAWYDETGNVYVGNDEDHVRQKYGLGADVQLRQDEDVLDTWFSSALWPFSTLGWPEQTERLKTFYPTSVLVTGFDIIFFWVARMIMMGLKFMEDVPFHEIYVHGLVRDAHGQKMSKSKGNVLDPIDLIDGIDLEALVAKRTSGMMQPHLREKIEKLTRKEFADGIPSFGTDALRFTLASLASTGRDVNFDMGRIAGYRNFCNKLWNATRYVLMNTEGEDCGVGGEPVELSIADRWIISRLQEVEESVEKSMRQYRFDHIAQNLYRFVWDEYCSWYLELSKVVLNDDNSSPEQKRGTRRTLVRVLEAILRLLHPLVPFITEELWLRVAPLAGVTGDTIMLQPHPVANPRKIDREAMAEQQWSMDIISGTRTIKAENNVAPGKPIPVILTDGDESDRTRLLNHQRSIELLAKTESILFADEVPADAVSFLVGDLKVNIPLGSIVDIDAEIARLKKEIEKLENDLKKSEAKLQNPNFVDKAPDAVVAKEKARVEEMQAGLAIHKEQLLKMGNIAK